MASCCDCLLRAARTCAGLVLSDDMLTRLGRRGRETWLFYPKGDLSDAARAYVDAGHTAGVDQAYKCRVRKTWYRVPLVPPADLLLTCMNADTAPDDEPRRGATWCSLDREQW